MTTSEQSVTTTSKIINTDQIHETSVIIPSVVLLEMPKDTLCISAGFRCVEKVRFPLAEQGEPTSSSEPNLRF